ncbi:MAG: PAS domain S-box protein [Alphaproteobacteria bacterium]|nr:PAS domain S-box protein [Alphaproteobacteria bacterium]MBU2082434.1 PAS domain S-box protein [Alphaproteobacteria bacterium]MBU2197383.1 PAS domain S-box protein [Alphaproteobacteria bacterium]
MKRTPFEIRNRLDAVLRNPLMVHLLILIGSFEVAAASILLTRGSGDVSAVWPVNAIMLVVVLMWQKSRWPSIFGCIILGYMAANVYVGDPLLRGVFLTVANSLEILIVALMLHEIPRDHLARPAGIMKLILASAIACAVSTTIAVLGFALTGAPLLMLDAALWFFADFLGLILIAPLVWALTRKGEGEGAPVKVISALEFLLVIAVTVGVFVQSTYPLLFFVPAVLVPITLRHGVRGAAIALAGVMIISVIFTLFGRGPTALTQGDVVVHMLILQTFLAANSFMALTLGATVSERRRLTQSLQTSERRMAKRAANEKMLLAKAEMAEQISQVGHWTLETATGAVYWSPEVYRIHGVTPDTFNPALGDAIEFFADGDRERVSAIVENHMANGKDWSFEATLVRRSDGVRRRVMSIAKCHVDEDGTVVRLFGVFKDITTEHELYAKLARQEEQYRLLAEYSTDIVLKFGLDGVINYASPSAAIIMDPEKSIGMRTVDFVIPEDRDYATALTRALFTGEEPDRSQPREYRVRLADGSITWLEGSPQIIRDKSGKPVEVVSTFRDVSERHEREKALAEARLEAEASTQARTDFLSNMSHEIRTPLNGVLGFTDILKTTALTDKQLTYVQRISSAGRTLLEIVNDILDFSKIDAGRLDVEKRPFDLRSVIDDVVTLIGAARPNPAVRLSYEIAPDIADAVVGDETRVRQILTNIVGNAAKFTDAGHVRLDARVRHGKLCIIVADTGPGIPADKLQHVFTGFSQADTSITRRFGGSGLGLSISRSLANLMEGELSLVSEEGEGTNAILTLPYIPDRRTGRTDAPDIKADRRAPVGVRIMVVDDVEMNRALLEIGLSQTGHQVTTFASAPDAILALLEGRVFDLILMDVQMPEMDGLAATRRIRQLPGAVSRTPIVALTANALASQAEECRAAGMDAHFPKPVDMVRLNGLIDRLLRRQASEAAGQAADAEAKIAALKELCRKDISELPGKLGALLKITATGERAKAIAALAHSVAGTSGSLGFVEVSQAAFRLEAKAKHILEGTASPASLDEEIDHFVSVAAAA